MICSTFSAMTQDHLKMDSNKCYFDNQLHGINQCGGHVVKMYFSLNSNVFLSANQAV